MLSGEPLTSIFVISALLGQALLIINFAARNWRPSFERAYGWVIYALGIPSFLLGILFLVAKQPWYLTTAPFVYSIWAAYAAFVDVIRPAAWRSPPRWSIFIPYVGLFMASQFAYWIPLWSIDTTYWIAYGVMYFASTGLNLYSHAGGRRAGDLGME